MAEKIIVTRLKTSCIFKFMKKENHIQCDALLTNELTNAQKYLNKIKHETPQMVEKYWLFFNHFFDSDFNIFKIPLNHKAY